MVQQMLANALLVTIFTLSVIIAAISLPDRAADTPQQKLQLISVSKERLEANFYTPNGGIHILSKVHSDGELVRISITSARGESIFRVDYPVDHSQGLLSIAGSDFLMINETLINGETKLTEYAVPEAYSVQVKTAMKQRTLPKSMLRHLDSENVNVSGQSAIERLLMRPEVQIIAAAAVAIGNTGLHGYDNPAAMAFYATALRFTTVTEEHLSEVSAPVDDIPSKRNPRGIFDWLYGNYCSNSDSYCYGNTCPQGQECIGLCGPGCTCWWWVCGDCCWNVGCYLHDQHGCPNGRNTLQCWLTAPVALLCT